MISTINSTGSFRVHNYCFCGCSEYAISWSMGCVIWKSCVVFNVEIQKCQLGLSSWWCGSHLSYFFCILDLLLLLFIERDFNTSLSIIVSFPILEFLSVFFFFRSVKHCHEVLKHLEFLCLLDYLVRLSLHGLLYSW